MREKILKIITTTDDFYEGIYGLDAFQMKLSTSEKMAFWEAIEDLAWTGTLHERDLALYAISIIKPDLVPKIVPRFIEKVDIEKEFDLLPSVLSMIRNYRYYQYRDFCVQALEAANKKQNEMVCVSPRKDAY